MINKLQYDFVRLYVWLGLNIIPSDYREKAFLVAFEHLCDQ
jgi:hypothetical protein